MTITHQQVSGALVVVNEQTHNGGQSTIDEVEEQARRLSNVEHNVDTMRAAMERMMMHMAQSLRAQQPTQQHQ